MTAPAHRVRSSPGEPARAFAARSEARGEQGALIPPLDGPPALSAVTMARQPPLNSIYIYLRFQLGVSKKGSVLHLSTFSVLESQRGGALHLSTFSAWSLKEGLFYEAVLPDFLSTTRKFSTISVKNNHLISQTTLKLSSFNKITSEDVQIQTDV